MIVVSDTSPVNYLILIGRIDLLRSLFGHVILPQAVVKELQAADAPPPVREWISQPPAWLEAQSVGSAETFSSELDEGESEAIALAYTLRADLLLMDEADGRQAAVELGLKVMGTLGILARASLHGLIDFNVALADLTKTSFRASPHLIETLIEQYSGKKAKDEK